VVRSNGACRAPTLAASVVAHGSIACPLGYSDVTRLIAILILVFPQVSGCAIQEEIEAGAEFGASHDMDECLSESLARLDSCDSASCEFLVPGFARACASTAEYSARFCNSMSGSVVEAASEIHERCRLHANQRDCFKVYQHAAKRCID
jgi:hypothetical protein